MSLAQALSTYFTLNILIVAGACALWTISFFIKLKSVDELRFHYRILAIAIVISALHPFLPANQLFQPTAKVWSAQSIKSFPSDYADTDKGGYLALSSKGKTLIFNADKIVWAWESIALLLLILGGLRLLTDIRSLLSIRRNSYLIRKIGRVSVVANSDILVPFSYWFFARAYVVIPSNLLDKKTDYSMAVAHELQHHRQRDTLWIYVFWFLRLICVANPFIHLWNKWICEIQEFACDEALVDQYKVDSQAYARCLVEVAQTAIHQKQIPVCATGLTFLIEGHLLKRRIEKMIHPVTQKPARSIGIFLTAALTATLTVAMLSTAYASKNIVQDRHVSMQQALEMAKAVPAEAFPISVNELVLKELNRYIGTPEGRDYIKTALERMQNEKTFVEAKLTQYQMPREFLAIPIIESGYQNLPQSSNKTWGAGLWMFIESTARNYGLKVDTHSDERLNVALETDAAMRYLSANYQRFQDWRLSALAYNIGEHALQTVMDKTGSRDPWVLVRNGANGESYLPRLTAAILIMNNPDSLN
jgi:beta-lactamase regulating signal transducer with metallopeptidase domain